MMRRIPSNVALQNGTDLESIRHDTMSLLSANAMTGTDTTSSVSVDEATCNPDVVLTSETLTGLELFSWAQSGKRDHLQLTSGERFAFDAHGIWLTYSEIRKMRDRTTPWWEGDQSFWVNGIAPLFPPA